jgi:AmmeMemoRadiSam system protein A
MPRLEEAARKALLELARSEIARAIGVEGSRSDALVRNAETLIPAGLVAGAFVTLRSGGQLRGCIGYPEAEFPLVQVVRQCAISAALSDPRFPPLTRAEWPAIDLELSVLGPVVPVSDLSELDIGRHGLIVESGGHRGLLLPQVAVEWNWNAEEFAAQTCRKAGLPGDAWRAGAKLFWFEAEIFSETRP